MQKSCFGEEQIVGILKQREAGLGTTKLCPQHGIRKAPFYNCKPIFNILEDSVIRDPRQR